MFWQPRTSSLIVPRELHDRVARSCVLISEVPSEVIAVRRFSGVNPEALQDPPRRPYSNPEKDLVRLFVSAVEPVGSCS